MTEDQIAGILLGTALGDALGLPWEGMSATHIGRRRPTFQGYALVGRTGFVSDDTEQSVLLGESLLYGGFSTNGGPLDEDKVVRHFRRALLGWTARLPFGIGLATMRASLRILIHVAESGVVSAGNGAAMRASLLGVVADPGTRQRLGRRLAEVSHRDPRAVDAALFLAELVAVGWPTARAVVRHPELGAALDRANQLAEQLAPAATEEAERDAALALGTTGFVMESVPLVLYWYRRFVCRGAGPAQVLPTLVSCVRCGGDTDSNAAMLGALIGATVGASGLPATWIQQLHDGPFGPKHQRELAGALAGRGPPPRWSWLAALGRNLALYPVVVVHVLRRVWPW